eukprot:6208873-Pleurochrysis_carterae.AAC.2
MHNSPSVQLVPVYLICPPSTLRHLCAQDKIYCAEGLVRWAISRLSARITWTLLGRSFSQTQRAGIKAG